MTLREFLEAVDPKLLDVECAGLAVILATERGPFSAHTMEQEHFLGLLQLVLATQDTMVTTVGEMLPHTESLH